jgi:hypothetical protein
MSNKKKWPRNFKVEPWPPTKLECGASGGIQTGEPYKTNWKVSLILFLICTSIISYITWP